MSYDPCGDAHIQAIVATAKPLSRERYLTLSLLLAPVVDAQAAAEERLGAESTSKPAIPRQAA